MEHGGGLEVFLRDLYSKASYVSNIASAMLSRPTVPLLIFSCSLGELDKFTVNLAEISNGFVHNKQFFPEFSPRIHLKS